MEDLHIFETGRTENSTHVLSFNNSDVFVYFGAKASIQKRTFCILWYLIWHYKMMQSKMMQSQMRYHNMQNAASNLTNLI